MPIQTDRDKSFWEGFGSVLSLTPRTSYAFRCYYNGRDIRKTKMVEALAEDWKSVGAAIGVILKRQEEDDSIRSR